MDTDNFSTFCLFLFCLSEGFPCSISVGAAVGKPALATWLVLAARVKHLAVLISRKGLLHPDLVERMAALIRHEPWWSGGTPNSRGTDFDATLERSSSSDCRFTACRLTPVSIILPLQVLCLLQSAGFTFFSSVELPQLFQ